MARAGLKTKKTGQSVAEFLNTIGDDRRRKDCRIIARIMKDVTGSPAKMWGPSMVGFGSYHYTYESGREGDWFLTGFSSRKANLTLYIMAGFGGYEKLMAKLGKHKTGKSCLYINGLEDVDIKVLTELITKSARHIKKLYP